MKKIKLNKLIFIFLLGTFMFFINNKVVNAKHSGEDICRYDGEWGSLVFYKYYSGDAVEIHWDYEAKEGQSHSVSVEQTYHNKLLNSKYYHTYDKETGSYVCPKIYYDVETIGDIYDPISNTSYTSKSFTFSNYKEVGTPITSSIGNTYVNPNDKYCEDQEKYLKVLSSNYDSQVLSYLNNLNALWQDSSKYENMNASTYRSTAEQYANLAKKNAKELAEDLEDIVTKNPGKLNNCSNALSIYNDLYNKLSNVSGIIDRAIAQIDSRIDTMLHNAKLVNDEERVQELEELKDELEEHKVELTRIWNGKMGSGNGAVDCEGLLGSNVKADIEEILKYIRIIVPILVIVLGIVDFAKVVISGDEKAMSKAVSNLIKRVIAAVAVFFAPIIIMYLINLIDNLAGGCDLNELFIVFKIF